MAQNLKSPTTLLEAITYFSDKQNCLNFAVSLRWANGVECPCGSKHVTALTTRQLWQCKECRKQFGVKVGTIFEDSPLPLSKWLPAMWLLMNAKNGISSHELHRSLGVTQKTAWFMLHRIRESMRNGSIMRLSGTVEADESFLGGKLSNKHANDREQAAQTPKTIVFGMIERGGNVVAEVVDTRKRKELSKKVHNTVEQGSKLYTDALASYNKMNVWYDHDSIDHSAGEYVRGQVHTNSIENFWSIFKRTVKGTYIHIAPFHTDRYLDEQVMRYNTRKGNDGTRFDQVVSQVVGRRLTYAELTGKS